MLLGSVVPDVLKECRVCACEHACACPRVRLDCCMVKPYVPLKRQEPLNEQCREPGSSMYTLPTVLLISFLSSVVIWLRHLLDHTIRFCLHSFMLQLNWTRYLDYILDNTNVTLDYDSDHLVVMDIDYLQKLTALVSITDQETLGEYILLVD